MTLTLASVVRAVGGTLIGGTHTERTPIDGLARIAEFFVVGNPAFATLVTGSVSELGAGLRRQSDAGTDVGGALCQAVFVTSAKGAELLQLLAAHGMTAIVGTALHAEHLHLKLAAMLADDQAADDRLVTTGTKVLTQVARRGGVPAVMAELSHRIDGWAVLLDPQGHLIASAGAGRLHVNDAAAVALGRPVRVRHQGLQTHQVGSDRELAGYLVIASRSSVNSRNRDLASQASALFDLLLRKRDPSITEDLGRQALIDVLLSGGVEARELLQRWGVREQALTAFDVRVRGRTVDPKGMLANWLDDAGAEHVFASGAGRAHGFAPEAAVAELTEHAQRFRGLGGEQLHLGIGLPAPVTALRRSAAHAKQAAEVALDTGRRVVLFTELPTAGLVLDALEGDRTQQLVGVLDPLRDASGAHGELLHTLEVFLSENSKHRASAARLGVHRQTLLTRIRRIEELTGLSLERPDDQAAAWLAIRVIGS